MASSFYTRAVELREETVAHRRTLHTHAEVGLDLPFAREYVTRALRDAGVEPIPCGMGVSALLGKARPESRTILLRADMDALPMPELSGEPFACPTGTEAHACGHDFHAAMLLTAAKMLKEREDELPGQVKLMFQPAEETFEGSRNMIEAGILENPRVDAALALHVAPGHLPIGCFMYNATGTMMNSVDGFRLTVKGRGGHGAYPHLSVDPIQIGVRIYTALEGLIAREANPEKTIVLTVGRFSAGAAANIIPDEAVLEGTLRTNDADARALLVRRIEEIATGIAELHGGSATREVLSCVPPLVCDGDLANRVAAMVEGMGIPGARGIPGMASGASEDFATVAERVPAAMLYLSAGYDDARGDYSAHNPRVRFNEDVLPIGAAIYAEAGMTMGG